MGEKDIFGMQNLPLQAKCQLQMQPIVAVPSTIDIWLVEVSPIIVDESGITEVNVDDSDVDVREDSAGDDPGDGPHDNAIPFWAMAQVNDFKLKGRSTLLIL